MSTISSDNDTPPVCVECGAEEEKISSNKKEYISHELMTVHHVSYSMI